MSLDSFMVHPANWNRTVTLNIEREELTMSTPIFGDALARGISHQMARSTLEAMDRRRKDLPLAQLAHIESRNTAYKKAQSALKTLVKDQLLSSFELGEGKRRVWFAYVAFLDEQAGISMSLYRIPFKNPKDIDYVDVATKCHPHALQRLVQILGAADASAISAIWMEHAWVIQEAINQDPEFKGDRRMTFSDTTLLIWRRVEDDPEVWEAITAIPINALYGPNFKKYLLVLEGTQDPGVYDLRTDKSRVLIRPELKTRVDAALSEVSARYRAHSTHSIAA